MATAVDTLRSHKHSNSGSSTTKVVQVTNIAPQATKDQMQNLFGCIGKIDEIRLYPTVRDVTLPVHSRVCYVKFFESSCVAVAQHLTNTVYIDRALVVCPVNSGQIPDEFKALELTSNGTGVQGDTALPPGVENYIDGGNLRTRDPKLEENNLPPYPDLPASTESRKVEEIRRTIIVIDISSDWDLEEIMEYFSKAGEIKYARFAEKNRVKYAMIEYCEQKSVINALKLQGNEFLDRKLNIYHSTQAIIKPEAKSNEAAQREIEEAMSIVKEAQNMISAAIDPVIGILSSNEKTVVRRRSSRSRSRSRSRSKRSRSKKRSKKSRSRSRSKRKRSRSRSRDRRRSRSKKRSRSRSKRPRSRDRERRRRSRSRRRSRTRTPDVRRRSRSKSRERRRSRSHDRRKPSRKDNKRNRRSRSRSRSKSKNRVKNRPNNAKESRKEKRSRSRESTRREPIRDRESTKDRETTRDRDAARGSTKDRESTKDRDRTSTKDRESVAKSTKDSSRSSTRDGESSRRSSSRDRDSVKELSKEPTKGKETRSKKLRRISEEKVVRNYDEEENIGLTEDTRSSRSSPEQSADNMDISNSP